LEDFIFHEANTGEKRAFEFEPSFFHNPDFLFSKLSTGWTWYYALRRRSKKVALSFYVNIGNNVAESCIQSPFGTIEGAEDILPEVIFNFLEFVERRLRIAGVTKIIIKNQPFHYDEKKNALLETFLFNLGYKVVDAEVGAVRFVTSPFKDGLNRLEKRRLKKCIETGLTVHSHPNQELEKVYSFIVDCRQLKGYALSMTLDQLSRVVKLFPERYVLASVQKDNIIVGASIAVRVSSNILYNFYADHHPVYDAISPVVLVVKMLYDYCHEKKMKILDMGTSAINGKPNFGLLNLKMRLGATPSSKLTFEKLLQP